MLSKNKTQFLQSFHLFQVVSINLFHFLSLHKPCTYPRSFLILFQLIKCHKFFVSRCFCIWWYPFTNESALNFVVTTIGIFSCFFSFAKSIFDCETFSISFIFSCFWSWFFSALMLCKPGFYFLFRNNVFQVGIWEKKSRYTWNGSWMEWNSISNYFI